MSRDDPERDQLRDSVSCAAVLEAFSWKFDRKESTRNALKYRRGAGEIIIVNHRGHGWWEPQSTARGDVFTLVQHLDPGRNFGAVRRFLRPLVGLPARQVSTPAARAPGGLVRPLQLRWSERPRLRHGSPAWSYLTGQRYLPASVLRAAIEQDVVREGFRGSAWFAHRAVNTISHVEARGPDFRGSLAGGHKSLFRLGGTGEGASRLAITEAPIDALSLAAIEHLRPDTLWVATGGGMGPGTIRAIEVLLATMAGLPGAVLVGATDADAAGDRYAAHHADLASAAGVAFERLRPAGAVDWNDILTRRRGA
jgi:hypothetical protein